MQSCRRENAYRSAVPLLVESVKFNQDIVATSVNARACLLDRATRKYRSKNAQPMILPPESHKNRKKNRAENCVVDMMQSVANIRHYEKRKTDKKHFERNID